MKVKFLPINKEIEINNNESVLELAKRTGIFIKSICGGVPSCSECRVKVVAGEHNILPPSFKEKSLIGSAYFIDHSRLSCQIKCLGDITVDLTEQIEKEHAQPVSKKPRMPMRRQPQGPGGPQPQGRGPATGPGSQPQGQGFSPTSRNQFRPPSFEKKSTGDEGDGENQ